MAIEEIPDMIIDVNIPPDIKIRTGKVASKPWGEGGAIQFEIPHPNPNPSSWYSNARQ